jgi:hypothetical protein
MPDQVRHDGVTLFSCRVNNQQESRKLDLSALKDSETKPAI